MAASALGGTKGSVRLLLTKPIRVLPNAFCVPGDSFEQIPQSWQALTLGGSSIILTSP